jgi:hypothetical protein
VAALVAAGRAAAPEAGFAAELEARLQDGDGAGIGPWPHADAGNGRARPSAGRRPAWRRWMALAAMVLLAIVLLTPPARAGVELLIRLGAVRIGLAQVASPTPPPSATASPTPLPSVLDLAGATTLDTARARAGFPVRLPAYPPDLGPPSHMFLQDVGGPMVALVWTDPAHPDRARLALFEMTSDVYVYKSNARIAAETTVHGNRALWTDGPYLVEVIEGGQVVLGSRRVVTGHALIWTEGGITYRLETDLPLNEAVRVAESLR